jgi:hypothetical protein
LRAPILLKKILLSHRTKYLILPTAACVKSSHFLRVFKNSQLLKEMEELNLINTRIERLERKISELNILQDEAERQGNIQKALDILERSMLKLNQVRRLQDLRRAKTIILIESLRSTVTEEEFEDIVAPLEAMVGPLGLRPSEP